MIQNERPVPARTKARRTTSAAKSALRSLSQTPNSTFNRSLPRPTQTVSGVLYTCPMDPEIRQKWGPGLCPKCGMALEPAEASLDESPNAELVDMTRRFWVCAVLAVPLLVLAMSDLIPGMPLQRALWATTADLASVCAGYTHRPLGWLAVLSARRCLGEKSQSQHVHSDRARYWSGVPV